MDKTDTKHVRFYYLRDVKGNPFGCVCTIRTDDNKFHRGISLCNAVRGDRFSKQIGRNISYARALKASEGVRDNCRIMGLSDYLYNRMEYVYEKYWLTKETAIGNFYLDAIEPDVILTTPEKNMWKDILSPESLPNVK